VWWGLQRDDGVPVTRRVAGQGGTLAEVLERARSA